MKSFSSLCHQIQGRKTVADDNLIIVQTLLTFRDSVLPGQLHVLGVPPRHSLNRRVKPERLSDAHGCEGKAGQILPNQ